jgi:hypothetical protein
MQLSKFYLLIILMSFTFVLNMQKMKYAKTRIISYMLILQNQLK